MGIVLFLLALASDVWRAFVLSCLWTWAIIPKFDAPPLNTGIIFLFMIMVQVFAGTSSNSVNSVNSDKSDETKTKELLDKIIMNAMLALIVLIVAAVIY